MQRDSRCSPRHATSCLTTTRASLTFPQTFFLTLPRAFPTRVLRNRPHTFKSQDSSYGVNFALNVKLRRLVRTSSCVRRCVFSPPFTFRSPLLPLPPLPALSSLSPNPFPSLSSPPSIPVPSCFRSPFLLPLLNPSPSSISSSALPLFLVLLNLFPSPFSCPSTGPFPLLSLPFLPLPPSSLPFPP